jgi:hypothetical protein
MEARKDTEAREEREDTEAREEREAREAREGTEAREEREERGNLRPCTSLRSRTVQYSKENEKKKVYCLSVKIFALQTHRKTHIKRREKNREK